MALEREVYKALEDIVGPEYITEEPAILDSYCFVWANETYFGDKFSPRPDAVILPGGTEEVQAIVRVCNRYRVKFRAHATGFSTAALGAAEGFLPIDLRRMDRILEIDGKNMYAVVEPYVSFAELTYEAIKVGLRPFVIGAGCSCSVLASATSHAGFGTTNLSAGFGGRTPLGVEWVLPDGEILRLGSLGTGTGWFTGDGPGPSLRGVMRGMMGANGALGVITKAAIKLAPWYGPPRIETTGEPPSYMMQLPKELRVYTVAFLSREKLLEAMCLIDEEGIAYSCSRRGPFTMVAGMTGSNKELWEMWQKGYFQEKYTDILSLVMDASSAREMEYREKVLAEILDRTGGEILPEQPRGQSARFAYAFMGYGALKGTLRPSGGILSAPWGDEAMDMVKKLAEAGYELKDKLAKAGKLLDDGDPTYFTPFDGMGIHMELPFRYDPRDPDAVNGAIELMASSNKLMLESRFGIGFLEGMWSYNDALHRTAGPQCLNYHLWMRKIKKAFDPNLVSEPSFYTRPE